MTYANVLACLFFGGGVLSLLSFYWLPTWRGFASVGAGILIMATAMLNWPVIPEFPQFGLAVRQFAPFLIGLGSGFGISAITLAVAAVPAPGGWLDKPYQSDSFQHQSGARCLPQRAPSPPIH